MASASAPTETGRSSRPSLPKRSISLRATLTGLVLAILVPALAASAIVLNVSYRNERAQLEQGAVQTVRALVAALDGELIKAEVAAQSLSTSAYLATGNLAAFHAQAKELLNRTAIGNNFVLSGADGQQILNTVRSFPGPLPRHGNPEQLRRVFESGHSAISDVYIGGVLRRPVMSIDVPVKAGDRIAYALSIGIFPERFGGILRNQGLPPGWIAAVLDTQGVIAARTLSPERFVGEKVSRALQDRLAQVSEGTIETVTPDGIPVLSVFSRSAISQWVVVIGIPLESYAADLRHRFLLLALGVTVLLGAGVGLAWLFAARIANSIHTLAAPALALGSGEAAVAPRTPLREVNEVATAIGMASDLLSRRTAELETANVEMQEFSYSISHDLSSPLRAIAGYAQIVEEDHGAKLDDDARRKLSQIRESTVRMSRLIDSLIYFMQMSRRTLVHDSVDMAALAREVFDALCDKKPPRRLELLAGALPPAWGDRTLLRRVLLNLLDNAMKFIPANADGRIEITAKEGDGETVYCVADNGVGFDMQYVGKLFNVFEHVHAPGAFEGVGIGLAVVKRIVGRHGGRVWAEGEVGRGARFFFALPVKPVEDR